MRRVFLFVLFLFFAFSSLPSDAMNFGLYKPEEEYGLFDGFKFNFKRRPGHKFVELKSEQPEEIERLEREKSRPKVEVDENEQFRFIRDGIIPM